MSEHDLLGDNCDDPYCAHQVVVTLDADERAYRAQHPRPRTRARHRVRRARWVAPIEKPSAHALTLADVEALVARSGRGTR